MFAIQRFDIRNTGAKGNAVLGAPGSGNDDAAAIIAAVAQAVASKQPAEIYFPPGIYRFTKPGDSPYISSGSVYDGTATKIAAILFSGVSNISIVFAPGAILMMDTGTDVGAIAFIGPGENITLDRVSVVWSTAPSPNNTASYSAVSFYGQSVEDSQYSLKNVNITNGLRVKNASFEALVVAGCQNFVADNISVDTCNSNAVHFFSCYNGKIDSVVSRNILGKTICFDAFYDTNGGTLVSSISPFRVKTMFGKWSNSLFVVNSVSGESSDGVVDIAGGYGIHIGHVAAYNCSDSAVSIYSTAGSSTNASQAYSVPASRRISINEIVAEKGMGLRITSSPQNLPGSHMDTTVTAPAGQYPGNTPDYSNPNYWWHDIKVDSVVCRDIPWQTGDGFKDGVLLEMVAGIKIGHVSVKTSPNTTNGTTISSVRFLNVQDIKTDDIEIIGDGSRSGAANGFHIDGFVGNAGTEQEAKPFNNISLGQIFVKKGQSGNNYPGSIRLINLRGANIGPIISQDAMYCGVFINISDSVLPEIRIINHNRGDSSTTKLNTAVQLSGRVTVKSIFVNYTKVGPVPNFISVFNSSATSDTIIESLSVITDSVDGGGVNFSGTNSSIIGSWLNVGTSKRGGIAYGLGTFTKPLVLASDAGNLVELSIDKNNNVRVTQVKPDTVYPIISGTGTVIS